LYISIVPAKELYFVGASLDELRDFPEDARREAGHQLYLVQLGDNPHDWKPMTSVGPGVYEIRIHTTLEHRVLYLSKHTEGIYVLHAFQKKTKQTRQADISLARERLKALNEARRKGGRRR
jgi:phage-related protein